MDEGNRRCPSAFSASSVPLEKPPRAASARLLFEIYKIKRFDVKGQSCSTLARFLLFFRVCTVGLRVGRYPLQDKTPTISENPWQEQMRSGCSGVPMRNRGLAGKGLCHPLATTTHAPHTKPPCPWTPVGMCTAPARLPQNP